MNSPLCKRLLSFVLAAATLISLHAAPAAVWAAELEQPLTITASATRVNPVYAHLEASVSDGAAVASTGETYEAANAQEAAALLKELMLLRTDAAVIQLPVDFAYDAENTDAFWAEVWAMEEEIFAEAVAHTGDPQEGDYLFYNYYMRDMQAGASIGDTTTVSISYTFTYHADAQQEQEVCDAVDSLLADWAMTGATDYEKVCAAYNWLCQNVDYSATIDATPSAIYSSYGALVDKNCVCQGYAVSLYRLLLELGVDCRVISGTDADGGDHAWNIIGLDGVYYNADATWDTSWLDAGQEYAWFLKCESNFPEHIRDAEFSTESFYAAYPMAAADYSAGSSEEDPVSGTCGDSLTWTLDETGLLTISGTGEMTEAPWLTDYAGSITAVHMEEGITAICDKAFHSCANLTAVTIPEGVTSIGTSAFYGCLALPELILPQSLRTIGKSAFSDCDALTEMVIPEGVTAILLDTFAGCYRLTSVTVPSTVTEIDQCAFLSCPSLKSFVFPEGIGIVEFELFMNCYTLAEVTIPSSVCVIKGCAFQDCDRLGEVTIPDCVFSIGDYAFYQSGITALRVGPGGEVDRTLGANTLPAIPDGIGRYSFSSCSYLTEVEITPQINEIGEYAFAYSSNLTQCTFLGDAPVIDATAFTGVTATMYYPAGNETWTEDIMQDYGGTLTWVAYGVETEEPFTLSGTSVSLGDSLDMHFFVDPANVDESCYAVLTRYYADGRDDHVVTVPYSQWNALEDGTLYVTYGNIAAKEMGDYVEVTIYNGSSEAVSELWVDSVKSYAMRMLGKDEVIANQQLRTLYVDMLNYGAAAQAQFGYNVTMPANDLLTEEQLGYATATCETESNLVSGPGRAGTTLTLKSWITLDFIFKNTAIGTDYTGLYAIATYTDHHGETVETRIDAVEAYNANLGYVSVPGLAVADYGQAVTCTVYDAEGNAIAWATDSIEGYAHRMRGSLPEMVEAIVKFGTSAYHYFH